MLVQPFADPRVGAVSGNAKVGNRARAARAAGSTSSTSSASTSTGGCSTWPSACRPCPARSAPSGVTALRADRRAQRRDPGRGHRPDDGAVPRRVAGRLRGARARVDRGAGVAGRAVAAAVPLVLRHAAGDVEAPRRVGAARSGRASSAAAGWATCCSSRCCCRCWRRWSTCSPSTACCSSTRSGCWAGLARVPRPAVRRWAAMRSAWTANEPVRCGRLPLQQFVYRQLMYLVVIQSVFTALAGSRLRWQRMERYGSLVTRAPPAAALTKVFPRPREIDGDRFRSRDVVAQDSGQPAARPAARPGGAQSMRSFITRPRAAGRPAGRYGARVQPTRRPGDGQAARSTSSAPTASYRRPSASRQGRPRRRTPGRCRPPSRRRSRPGPHRC